MLLDLDYRDFRPPGFPGVTVQVRPLETWAFQEAMQYIGKRQSAEANQQDKRRITLEFMSDGIVRELGKKILPKHARNLTGLEIKTEGGRRNATLDDVTDAAPLLGLLIAMLTHLITISMLTEAEAGNSEGPSDSSVKQDGSGNLMPS